MPSSELKIKKYRLERHKEQYKKRSSRRLNFTKLKNGLIEKYINDDLDLKDRQLDSILKLVDPKTDETDISQGYFHACTAFGKTYLMIALAESYRYIEPNKKIIILEESTKVLEQVKKDFIEKTNFNEDDIGAYYGKEKTPSSPIITCTYASMEKMLNEVGQENIGLVLCDEAHHILSQNRQRVAQAFSHACLYGFTATPEYDKDRDCANVFGKTIDSVTLR
jgi:superfamily II DNA or RNA helicase